MGMGLCEFSKCNARTRLGVYSGVKENRIKLIALCPKHLQIISELLYAMSHNEQHNSANYKHVFDKYDNAVLEVRYYARIKH